MTSRVYWCFFFLGLRRVVASGFIWETFETLAVPHLTEALGQRKEEVSGGLTLL